MAKAKHAEMFGKDAPINRVKIRKFKKEFKKMLGIGPGGVSGGSVNSSGLKTLQVIAVKEQQPDTKSSYSKSY